MLLPRWIKKKGFSEQVLLKIVYEWTGGVKRKHMALVVFLDLKPVFVIINLKILNTKSNRLSI